MSQSPEVSATPIRLLIAGCGDLGMRVARKVMQHPLNQVWGLRRSLPGWPEGPENLAVPGMKWITADLSRPETLQSLPEGITHLLFSAAPNARTEAEYRAVYLQGLQNIANSLLGASLKRIMFVSSTAVYGEHLEEWVDERTATEPKHFNGKVLLESEQWLKQFGSTHDITTLSLRLSGIYGPGRTYLLDKLRLGQVGAPSLGTHWANRIHVEDAAAAIVFLAALPRPESTYLITDSTPLDMRVLYEDLARRVGGPLPALSAAPAMVGSKRLSNARLLATGFTLQWPDSRTGYAELI